MHTQVEGQIEGLLARQRHLLDAKEALQQRLSADRRAPRADWRGAFAWDAEVGRLLQDVFSIASFRWEAGVGHMHICMPAWCIPMCKMHDVCRQGRMPRRPLQQEVINATLQGRDVLCLMPTGLCSTAPSCPAFPGTCGGDVGSMRPL